MTNMMGANAGMQEDLLKKFEETRATIGRFCEWSFFVSNVDALVFY